MIPLQRGPLAGEGVSLGGWAHAVQVPLQVVGLLGVARVYRDVPGGSLDFDDEDAAESSVFRGELHSYGFVRAQSVQAVNSFGLQIRSFEISEYLIHVR